MKMGPASNKQPTKKSLRLWFRKNGHVVRKSKKMTYTYPRTVEAAKDPFVCDSGKNKMFYLIAINLFPDSKIVKPDDSESDEEEVEVDVTAPIKDCESKAKSNASIKSPPKPIRKRPEKPMSNTKLESSKTVAVPDKPSCNKRVFQKKASKKEKSSVQRPTSPSPRHPPQKGSSKKSKKRVSLSDYYSSKSIEYTPVNSSDESPNPTPPKKLNNGATLRKASTNIPTIMNSLQKIIQNCSETGKISFSLSKTPRQSRS